MNVPSLKFAFLLITSFFAITSLSSRTADAQAWGVRVDRATYSGASLNFDDSAGYIESFRAFFNGATKQFRWEITFSPGPGGKVPQGLSLVVTDGPSPQNLPGQFPIIYFDATNLNQPDVTVYGYNGGDPHNNWSDGSTDPGTQDPDRIFSSRTSVGSMTNPAGWLRDAHVEVSGSKRTFFLAIDTSFLENHLPQYPSSSPWKGLQFGGNVPGYSGNAIGIQLHSFANLSPSYFSSTSAPTPHHIGFLSNVEFPTNGSLRTNDLYLSVERENPTCRCVDCSSQHFVKEGKSLAGYVYGKDNQGDPFTINVGNLPPGATYSTSIVGDETKITVIWNNTAGYGGKKFSIPVEFVDSNGASYSCGVAFEVIPNEPPSCFAQMNQSQYQNLACSQQSQSVTLQGIAADPDASPQALTYSWSTDCSGSNIINPQILSSQLSLASQISSGIPTSCFVTLAVSDGISSSTCTSPVSVTGCQTDCSGTPNGTAIVDSCGVCGGNNTTCKDCDGTLFGTKTVDRCGVCGGNGMSCIQCSDPEITPVLLALDSRAFDQKVLVHRIAASIARKNKSQKTRRFAQALRNEANSLYVKQWKEIWALKLLTQRCNNVEFCTSISNEAALESANQDSSIFVDLTYQALRSAARYHVFSRSKNLQYQKLALKLHQDNVLQIKNSIPKTRDDCSSING